MGKGKKTVIVWSNAPDKAIAENIARGLMKKRLAACVHVFSAGVSIYRWEGEVHKGEEWTMMIKTRRKRMRRVVKAVKKMHPYDVPEIMVTPVVAGLKDYLSWVAGETS
ncbi:MAG: divalent-cation tolerance protein CutA [Magnetococcales bacterium]|nr:divalent-cation tolerance protein CutA [Magnetococcales bacterium]